MQLNTATPMPTQEACKLEQREHLEQIVVGCFEPVCTTLRRKTRNQPLMHAWVEDIVAEACFRLITSFLAPNGKLKRMDQQLAFRWLIRTAKRILIDRYRHEKVSRIGEWEQTIANTDSDDEKIFYDQIDQLGSDERQLFIWRYYEHNKLKQIADKLGISMSAVHNRLRRLHDKLRELLLANGYDPASDWFRRGWLSLKQPGMPRNGVTTPSDELAWE